MKILVDTSFIIAYSIKNDDQHEKSNELEHYLIENECFVTNGIISECITVAYNKSKNLEITNNIYYSIKDNFTIINEYDINLINVRTLDIFNKHSGKLSFVDSSLIVVMNVFDIDNLLTFDKQFGKEKTIETIGI